MRITSVRPILVSAPYASPGDAEREWHLKAGLRAAAFVRIDTDEVVYGLGETYAGVYAPEAVRALIVQFACDLIGQPATDIHSLAERLRLSSYYWGRSGLSQSVISAIEMALWDLKGKWLGQPVFELLGGKVHERLPVYASGGNDKPRANLVREMQDYVTAGYQSIKIRINNLSEDAIEEKVAVCHEAVGRDARLAVDAVQGTAPRPWDVKQAIRIAQRLEPYGLLWMEEPAEVTNYAGYAEIRKSTKIPVAGGETVTSLVEAESYLNAGALDLFQPDASFIGGIGTFRRVAQMCERKFVSIAAHVWCGGVGMMANYHAALASPNCVTIELSHVPNPLRDEMLVEPLRISEGSVSLANTPGLGVYLPDGLEEKYAFQPESMYRILRD